MNNIWYLEDKNKKKVHENEILNNILINRGIDEKEKAEKFIKNSYKDLEDPYKLTDMDKAASKIIEAFQENKRILIYGDYDVDGITSTSLLINYFKDNGFSNYNYYIPNRLKEGYGLNIDSLKNIDIKSYDLLITVDCGITAVKEVKYLKKEGIEVIITDHHKLKDKLPQAFAVVDPQRESFDYFKVLAGVGVVFKLLQAVDQEIKSDSLKDHLDLVALGTVADIVKLKNDNRILVKKGLQIIKNSKKIGVRQLISDLKLTDKEITPGQIGYIIAPPINAIGRMQNPEKGVELLTTESLISAEKISEKLLTINKERQKKEEEIYKQALEMIDPKDIQDQKPIVLFSKDWHRGVIGIVASRLVEKYYLPVILIAIDDQDIGHGSARSIDNFDITEGLNYTKGLLENFGGHTMAAGLSIRKDNIESFKKELDTYLKKRLSPKDFIPGLRIDSVIDIRDIDYSFYKNLELLKPYGVGNPRPKFLLSNIKLHNCYTVGKNNKHLKIKLPNGISGICFNKGEMKNKVKDKKIDLAVKIYLNNWRGKDEIEIRVEDINVRSDHSFFPITFKKNKFAIYDKRGIGNKRKYLKGLKKFHKRIVVYINGDSKLKRLKENLENQGIKVYNNNWDTFNDKESSIILFNKKFDKKLKGNPPLVLYSVPFSFSDLYKIIKNFQNNNINVHLIFNKKDLDLNSQLINSNLPNKKIINNIYQELKIKSEEDIKRLDLLSQKLKSKYNLNKSKFDKIIKILIDLKKIKTHQKSFNITINQDTELDLSNSVYYNNIIKVKKEFKILRKVLEDKNLFKFIDKLTNLKEENNGL